MSETDSEEGRKWGGDVHDVFYGVGVGSGIVTTSVRSGSSVRNLKLQMNARQTLRAKSALLTTQRSALVNDIHRKPVYLQYL